MRRLARSTYGQNLGRLYATVGVRGPREFGALPAETQLFWNEWFDEKLRRDSERADDISNTTDNGL